MGFVISLSNEQAAFLAVSTVIVFVLLGAVGAYNDPPGAWTPEIMGHSVDELNLSPLYIDYSAGRVGIGTESPGGKLDIKQASAAAGAGIRLIKDVASNYWGISYDGVDGLTFVKDGIDKIWFDRAGNTVFNAGNVGIGTTNPVEKLHIVAPDSGYGYQKAGLAIYAEGTNDAIALGTNGTDRYSWIQAFRVGVGWNDLVLNPRGGNIGIGTTSPSEALDVVGNIVASGTICDSVGCIGTSLSGVWQTVSYEDFESGATGWSPASTYTCITGILGGYGNMANGCLTKTFTSLPTHTLVKVSVDYWFGDSWDGEEAYAELDDTKVWARKHTAGIGVNTCSPNGAQEFNQHLELKKQHTGSSLKVELCSGLDQGATDEWFGVDNVEVSVQ